MIDRKAIESAYAALNTAIAEHGTAELAAFEAKLKLDDETHLAVLRGEIAGSNERDRKAVAHQLLKPYIDAHNTAERTLITMRSKLEAARNRVAYVDILFRYDLREEERAIPL